MRKSISIILCFALSMLVQEYMSDVAYADTVGVGSYSQEVRVKMSGACNIVYQVDISWGDMEYVYKTVGTRTWNEHTHIYKEEYVSKWSAKDNAINIMNHSNTSVEAEFTYVPHGVHTGVVGTFDKGSTLKLPSAEGKSMDAKELTGTKKLVLSGVLSNTLNEYIQVGNVNVKIK